MLLNPLQTEIDLDEEKHKFLLLSLRLFLAQLNSSQNTYNETIDAIRIAHPDDELLSFDQIKRRIALLTGVHAIIKDVWHILAHLNCWKFALAVVKLESIHLLESPAKSSTHFQLAL